MGVCPGFGGEARGNQQQDNTALPELRGIWRSNIDWVFCQAACSLICLCPCLQAHASGQGLSAGVHIPSSAPHSFEVGFGAMEQRAVLGRLQLAALQLAEQLQQQRSWGGLPYASSAALDEFWEDCEKACGGEVQRDEAREAAMQSWVLDRALEFAREASSEMMQQPTGRHGSELPLHYRPWFLAACRLSEGTGNLATDDLAEQWVQENEQRYAPWLAQRMHLQHVAFRWQRYLHSLMLATFQASAGGSALLPSIYIPITEQSDSFRYDIVT